MNTVAKNRYPLEPTFSKQLKKYKGKLQAIENEADENECHSDTRAFNKCTT